MEAGKLRHAIRIDNQTTSADSFGQPLQTYTTTMTTWASIQPISGAERLAGGTEIAAVATHRVRLRHTTVVNATTRLVFDSRTFEVNAVNDWREKGRYLELMCSELVG